MKLKNKKYTKFIDFTLENDNILHFWSWGIDESNLELKVYLYTIMRLYKKKCKKDFINNIYNYFDAEELKKIDLLSEYCDYLNKSSVNIYNELSETLKIIKKKI
ncbi:hypothetical protein XO12_06585 [Marinitoga sp. 1154]|nr:hypothetical protein [Marinitoga sp. 1154]